MKNILLLLFCSITLSIYAQDNEQFDGHKWQAPYELAIPTEWGVERFLLPPSFSSQITYKGVEDIRFTPGWGNSKSDEYWSYTFLWLLDEMPKTDASIIETNLQNYYTGLITVANGIPAQQTIPVVAKFKKSVGDTGDLQTYTGTVEMTDYMTKAPIMLHCKAHFKSCPEIGKTIAFFELSPKPFTNILWKSLDELWQTFKCKREIK